MTATPSHERSLRVEASADVGAPAAVVYRLIADYRRGHLRIIPPRYFRNLCAAEGGYGAGTIITYDMIAFGRTVHARAFVTEPEPGRVLVETDPEHRTTTAFVVEPLGSSGSRVTIATELPARGGLLGRIERAVTRSFLSRVYSAELARIDAEARADVASSA